MGGPASERPAAPLAKTLAVSFSLTQSKIRSFKIRNLDELPYFFCWQGAIFTMLSVFAVPFLDDKFGEPREIVLEGGELTAGVAFQGQARAVVACNQNHQVIKFDFHSGEILARVMGVEYPYAVKVLPGGQIAVSNW